MRWRIALAPMRNGWAAPGGEYFRWSDPSGAEIWLQVNANDELVGMNPHYAGRSSVRVGSRLNSTRLISVWPSELDGSFHGWADPDRRCGGFRMLPVRFRCAGLPIARRSVRFRCAKGCSGCGESSTNFTPQPTIEGRHTVAAFAHEINAFETVAAYNSNQTDDLKYASQSFIPSGLFAAAGGATVPPQARAISLVTCLLLKRRSMC